MGADGLAKVGPFSGGEEGLEIIQYGCGFSGDDSEIRVGNSLGMGLEMDVNLGNVGSKREDSERVGFVCGNHHLVWGVM